MSARQKLSERQCREFLTTAEKIVQNPWQMRAAANYILELVGNNKNGDAPQWQPPSLGWIVQDKGDIVVEAFPPNFSFNNGDR